MPGSEDLTQHDCREEGKDSWPEYDAQGIYLCRVCDVCVDAKLARYRPEILTGYTQADVDEPIEPEEEIPNYAYDSAVDPDSDW